MIVRMWARFTEDIIARRRNKWAYSAEPRIDVEPASLAPSPQISEDTFVFTTGPRIRLVRAESPGILGIVSSVRSLAEAEKFLKERQLLAKDDTGRIFISPTAIDGLSIQLVEK